MPSLALGKKTSLPSFFKALLRVQVFDVDHTSASYHLATPRNPNCRFQNYIPSIWTTEQVAEMSYPLEDVRPMFELRGRNYVVTGGAQGIGFAVTRAICEMGGNVAVMDIQDKPVDEKEWNSLSQKFGTKQVFIQTDVTKQESLNAAFARVVQELGSIDGLVPAAGIAIDKPFIEQTWEEFTRIQDINVGASFAALSESLLMPCLGQRHLFRSSAGYKTIPVTRQGWQHRPHCLAVKPHCAPGLVSLPVENAFSRMTLGCQDASKRRSQSLAAKLCLLPSPRI